MKDGLSIKAICRLLSIKKSYVFIAYNGIERKKITILGHVIL
jgi:hypothetical protein